MSYYGYDAHGNVTFLTDGTGGVTDTYDYDAWGNIVAQVGSTLNTRLYNGEELDPDLGFVTLRARYYKGSVGRFVTLDPATGRLSNPSTLNRYLFANGDPVTLWDPTGREAAVGYLGGLTLGQKVVVAAFAAYATLLAVKYVETIGSEPFPAEPFGGPKRDPSNCFVAAQIARQACHAAFKNAMQCEGYYLAALFLCIKGQMFDPLKPPHE